MNDAPNNASVALSAVIVAVTDEIPRVLTVPAPHGHGSADGLPALPHGPLNPEAHATLDRGLRQWVSELSGVHLGYVEQLYTFGDRFRDPREREGGPRLISVAYLALAQESRPGDQSAHWRDWYAFLPWEDWRDGRPKVLDADILPRLSSWLRAQPEQRERVELTFGLGGAPWDPERSLDRYELLYHAHLIPEAASHEQAGTGRAMALDHRRILATAVGRIRGKIRYRPVVFELLPPTFTLLQLQRVVEALAGGQLHKQNFRRLVASQGLVEPTGQRDTSAGGRPAELFRFRREALRERPAPGVAFSGARWGE